MKNNNNFTKYSFDDFLDILPYEIGNYIDMCKYTQQTSKWHPEGNCYIHTKIVFNRAKRSSDINLMLAAIFHDLGKAVVTKKTAPEKWSAHNHESISSSLVANHKEWIESVGADYDIVFYIVKNHMRIKQLDKMRKFKQEAFKSHPYYDLLEKFTEFDNMITDFSNDIN